MAAQPAKRWDVYLGVASLAVTLLIALWGFSNAVRVELAVLQTQMEGVQESTKDNRDYLRKIDRRLDAAGIANRRARTQPYTASKPPPKP